VGRTLDINMALTIESYKKILEKVKDEKSTKKIKTKKSSKYLSRPKSLGIAKHDAVQSALKGNTNTQLVTPGETGHFKEVYEKERKTFLGRYSLWKCWGGVLKMAERGTVGMIIILFVGIIVAIALMNPIIDTTAQMTKKQSIVNEAIDISSARIAGGDINVSYEFLVDQAPTGWKITDCPLESVSYGNDTSDYIVTTDYILTASSGVLTLKDTATTHNPASNSTYIDYTYCADGYNKDSSSRSILNLVLIFCSLIILAFIIDKAGIIDIAGYFSN